MLAPLELSSVPPFMVSVPVPIAVALLIFKVPSLSLVTPE